MAVRGDWKILVLVGLMAAQACGSTMAEERCYDGGTWGSTCSCPTGTKKVRTQLPGNKFPNGADLCKVLVPLSKATCIWEYHCAPATAQPVKPKKKTKATSSTDCSGDALTSLEIKTKLFNGYYDYTIKNSTHCFVCFTMNDCERTPDGSAECKTLAKRLGKKGSASGDEMGSNYRYEPIAKGIRFCK